MCTTFKNGVYAGIHNVSHTIKQDKIDLFIILGTLYMFNNKVRGKTDRATDTGKIAV